MLDLSPPRPLEPSWSPYRTLVAVDIVDFGRRCPDTASQRRERRELYGMLRAAFDLAGVSWATCDHGDRGDGVLVVAPPGVDPVAFLGRLGHNLTVALRRHNGPAGDGDRLRLRVAVHHGDVERDAYGVFGSAAIFLYRLLDADAFREVLRASDADLGLITSDSLHSDAVLRGGGPVPPSAYRRLWVSRKEVRDVRAWLWLSSGLVSGLEDR
ncbi:hypothetical protein BZB76_2320 [Actinomadura pelletieri DSM 43383]|uniref:Guanylate cyclase domain-containing protein n=1 Tax=Actinomadura pelletieri DSM 43383 TaxID=1120940 RepID=A0A495QTV0_9ACTN|nr:hypothetical protein [Actinomadura pelletieri]RKS76952.1 hypothetical protein BZB76_2320 [Actinomadura pelletieri DSM 43383]